MNEGVAWSIVVIIGFLNFFYYWLAGKEEIIFFQDQSSHPDSTVFNDRRIQGSTEETLAVRSLHVL